MRADGEDAKAVYNSRTVYRKAMQVSNLYPTAVSAEWVPAHTRLLQHA